jgi:hypothetical protein
VGEFATAYRPVDLGAAVAKLVDPAAAVKTVHWGRNYLYVVQLETAAGPLDVVVKQFRNRRLRDRLRRRAGGSKAARSWQMARALMSARPNRRGQASSSAGIWRARRRPAISCVPPTPAAKPSCSPSSISPRS